MVSEAGEAVSAAALIVPATVASLTPPAFNVRVKALAPAATPAQVGALRVKVTPAAELPALRVCVAGLTTKPLGNGVASVMTIVAVPLTGFTVTVAVAALPQYSATAVAGTGDSRLAADREPEQTANPSNASDFPKWVTLQFMRSFSKFSRRHLAAGGQSSRVAVFTYRCKRAVN